jgi:2-polyprenyl-3-methyl-5-hydroxy-6-metoxy-1,4-benzoquinol methylase
MAHHDSPSYKTVRKDLLKFVLNPNDVLDVGCNDGAVAKWLKNNYKDVNVWGIEINPEALEEAKSVLEEGWVMDLDKLDDLKNALHDLKFDHILAGDVLEHTWNWREITGIMYQHLKPGGKMIISVPNYGHWHMLYVFFTQYWPRNNRGVFDKTHRSPFMRRNLIEFLRDCPNAEFKLCQRNFRFFETNVAWKVNMAVTALFFPFLIIPYVRNFFVLNFVFSITKPNANDNK